MDAIHRFYVIMNFYAVKSFTMKFEGKISCLGITSGINAKGHVDLLENAVRKRKLLERYI